MRGTLRLFSRPTLHFRSPPQTTTALTTALCLSSLSLARAARLIVTAAWPRIDAWGWGRSLGRRGAADHRW